MRARRALALVLAATSVSACQRDPSPALVKVEEAAPRDVEAGDHLVLSGSGFPEGKQARVIFRGDLHRPRGELVRGVQIEAHGRVLSGGTVDVEFDAPLERAFVGPSATASHTTFHGSLELSFAAARVAAPPVTGVLEGMWLDVLPPSPPPSNLIEDGQRALECAGITAGPEPAAAGGIVVEAVAASSPAGHAHLLPGDVIAEQAGLRVRGVGDVVPSDGAPALFLRVRRAGDPREEPVELGLPGWKPRPVRALVVPAILLALAALLALLGLAPTPRLVSWSADAWVRRTARRASPRLDPTRRWAVKTAGLGLFAMSLGRVLSVQIEVWVLLVATVALAAVVLGSRGAGTVPTRLRVASGVILGVTPLALAAAAAVVTAGSLCLDDIVQAQSGWPWGWALWASPMSCALFLSAMASLIAKDPLVPALRSPAVAAAEEAHQFLACGLLVALLCGGWQIPGVTADQAAHPITVAILGGTVFVLKVGALAWVARAWPAVAPSRASRDRILALALAAVGFLLTLPLASSAAGETGRQMMRATVVLCSLGVGLHFAARVHYNLRVPATELELDHLL